MRGNGRVHAVREQAQGRADTSNAVLYAVDVGIDLPDAQVDACVAGKGQGPRRNWRTQVMW